MSILGSMSTNRPRLMVGSVAVAVIVIAVGSYVWSESVADRSSVDVVLENSQDRTIPPADSGIPRNEDVKGELLPDAVVLDAEGNEVSTLTFLGTPTVINFWFSTCVPCERELPDFAEVHAEVGDEVRFIGVNTVDSVPVMERFAAERGVTYELFQDAFAEFIEGAGIAAFPQTIFVSADGVIVDQVGPIEAEGLRKKIAELLEP